MTDYDEMGYEAFEVLLEVMLEKHGAKRVFETFVDICGEEETEDEWEIIAEVDVQLKDKILRSYDD